MNKSLLAVALVAFSTASSAAVIYDKDGVKDALDCPKNSFLNCQLF